MMKTFKIASLILVSLFAQFTSAQGDVEIISDAIRTISPSYRMTEKPEIIDTVIPIPDIQYPLLSRNMKTDISIDQIEASKIKLKDKLDKIYPGYVKLGFGNYASPLGELYYNSVRNRRVSYGAHVKHNSSFGNIKDYAPSGFDNTTGLLFGDFFTSRYLIETELNYLNNGYRFYGIQDTTDAIPNDSLVNRVQGIGGGIRFSNFTKKDSAKVLYTIKMDYMYFHEFNRDSVNVDRNARNSNFGIGTELTYKHKKNRYNLDFEFRQNNYKFGEDDPLINSALQHNDNNVLIHLKPTIATYGNKWKALAGLDINFDIPSDQQLKVVPIIEAKYSLLNNMFIPYAGIGGGVTQNSFYTLNRLNQFIVSSFDLKNTFEMRFYAGIKGTIAKEASFDVSVHSTTFNNRPLFVNDTIWSDLYRFAVVYDKVSALGITGSFAYQISEKLKIDAIAKYNNFSTEVEKYAWNLPAFDMKFRGSYNLYDKIYVKADVTLLGGRRSPSGLFLLEPTDEDYQLGFVADANLHAEYRYNQRLSVFVQFNNLAGQKYFRWNRYRVQGFQVLGGLTFAF
jgi:hypothetical protein